MRTTKDTKTNRKQIRIEKNHKKTFDTSPIAETDIGNGNEVEWEFHLQQSCFAQEFQAEAYNDEIIENGLRHDSDSSTPLNSLQPLHTAKQHENCFLLGIEPSGCFIKDTSSSAKTCQGSKQLIEVLSPMRSGKLETKIDYDILTDGVITCSVYDV